MLSDWDGAPYPAFERGELTADDVDRPDLFETKTEVRNFKKEADLIAGILFHLSKSVKNSKTFLAAFYALVRELECDVITGDYFYHLFMKWFYKLTP